MRFKRLLKNQDGFGNQHAELLITIFLIGLVSAIVVPWVVNYLRAKEIKPVKCLIALLELRDRRMDGIGSCPLTGKPFELLKTGNTGTVRCPDHYQSFGTFPRLEILGERRIFVQDLASAPDAPNTRRPLTGSTVLEKSDEGSILISGTPGRISRFFFLILGTLFLFGAVVALIFAIGGILHFTGTLILKIMHPKNVLPSSGFKTFIVAGLATGIVGFFAYKSFCAAGRMNEIILAENRIGLRTTYFDKQLSETEHLGRIETVFPMTARGACFAVYRNAAEKYRYQMLFERADQHSEVCATIVHAVRHQPDGMIPEDPELFSFKPYWPRAAMVVACFFLTGRLVVLAFWQRTVRREWKGLAQGVISWKQALERVAINRQEWQMLVQENKTFFMFFCEIVANAVLLRNRRDRRVFILKTHRHPALFASKAGIPTARCDLSSAALKVAALKPVRVKRLPAVRGHTEVYQIAGVRFKLRVRPKAALHHWVEADWAELKIRTLDGEVHISTPRFDSWPKYRAVLKQYVDPISQAGQPVGQTERLFDEFDRPVRFLLAKAFSIDAICFIVQIWNGDFKGIVQLYRPDGQIIFEVSVYADGTKHRVTWELLQFLSGIESPQIGYFGHKKTAIRDINILLKTYFKSNDRESHS